MGGRSAAGCPGGSCPLAPYCAVGSPDAGADPETGLSCPMPPGGPLASAGGRGKLDAACANQR